MLNLEALGNIGDFVGGLAVVITLIYLALQIRQNSRQIEMNTAATKAAAYHAQLTEARAGNMELVRDRQMAEWAFLDSLEGLDPIDTFRAEIFFLDILRTRQHLFLQAEDGLIRQELLGTHDAGLVSLFANPVVRDLWKRRTEQFVPEFVQHVDELLAERKQRTPEPWMRS